MDFLSSMDDFSKLVLIIAWPGMMVFAFLMYRFYFVPRTKKWREKMEEERSKRPPEPEDTRVGVFSIGTIQETPEGRPLIVGTVERGVFSRNENVQLVDISPQPVGPYNASLLSLRSLSGEVSGLKEGESGMLELGGVRKDQVTTRMVIQK